MTRVHWNTTWQDHPARAAAFKSMDAASRGCAADWLALFAPDAIVEDPVGPSMFDPPGNGHRGPAERKAFWENVVSQAERLEFHIHDSIAAGNEVINLGEVRSFLADGNVMSAEGAFLYRIDEDGLLVSVRAFWDIDRALAGLRPAE